MSLLSASKCTSSLPPRPRFSAAAPPVSARRRTPMSARFASDCRARCRCSTATRSNWPSGALALNCRIRPHSRFARKNYFYPDLPKGYQISQYDEPLAEHGYVDIAVDGAAKRIGVTRVHMEDDAGKSIHDGFKDSDRYSYVDLNRSGTPLIEIVSEPDMRSSAEAYAYLTEVKAGAAIHRSLHLRYGKRPSALRRQRFRSAARAPRNSAPRPRSRI